MAIALKRAYSKASRSDGTRILVDRLWPRGVSKAEARIDCWLKDVAPSNDLRKWYHARPSMWMEFRERYLKELANPEAAAALNQLRELSEANEKVTLLYGSKNEERNNATVLKELLEGHKKPPHKVKREPAEAAKVAQKGR